MKFKLLSVFLLAITLLYSCNNPQKNTSTGAMTDITVAQFGQEKYLIYLPFYLAMEKGYFKEQGLNIQIKYSGNDDQVFATVLKGEAQFGIGDPVFTAVSREKGAKGKVIASIVDGVSVWGVTKKPMAEITNADQLAGLKVGTFPAPSTVYTLIRNTIDKNPKLAKTTIAQAPIGSGLALLENGSADIDMELEPNASIAESKGYKVVYSMAKFYGPFAFTGVTTTEDYISQNRPIVQKFVNGLAKALNFAKTQQDSTIAVAQQLFPTVDKIVIANAVKRMIKDKTIPQSTAISDEAWQLALKIRKQVGDIKEIKPTSDAVDNSFANAASK